MARSPVLAVAGSANLDYVVPVDHHPATGETVLGGDHTTVPGGKGANQAVAAARLGAEVAFIGRVGADAAGAQLSESLASAGVELTHLLEDPVAPSGIAMIGVDRSGDNAIIVSPGANAQLCEQDILAAEPLLMSAGAVLLQLETPVDTVLAAARAATGIVVLDPAPAPASPLPAALLDAVDVLVPNETELAILTGQSIDATDHAAIEAAARTLGVETVVVTLGDAGAVVVTADAMTPVPAPTVTAVDTTAAGDAFRAALAIELLAGRSAVEAAEFAVRVGAATTLRPGAQPSLPTRTQLEELLAP